MPEDFFAQGIQEQKGILFSKQENAFLQQRLTFLDPRKSYQIPLGSAISLLKFTRLQPAVLQKIFNNCCKPGSKTITYDEMKKIFRGVALKQKGIQPSKINIQANIQTKMPILYDDSDDQQQQQQSNPRQSRQSQNITTPVNQPPLQKVQPPKPPQQQPDPLKMYDQFWKTLKTKNNTIDGAQVKRLCSNSNVNKNALSKAWKLCNVSEKGTLTKGQYFVFMNLINSNNIPQSLTKQMKEAINKIQQSCGYKKSTTPASSTQIRTSSSSVPQIKHQKKISSNVFDKFGDESLFDKKPTKIQDLAKSSVQNNPLNLIGSQQISSKSTSILIQKTQTLARQGKIIQKQVQAVAVNNENLSSSLQSVEQYLNLVEQNFISTSNQITNLKQSQQVLNQRLTNVCMSMKRIIQRQSECINSMMHTINQQNTSQIQQIKELDSYTNDMNKIVDKNIEWIKGDKTSRRKQQQIVYRQAVQQSKNLRQKMITYTQTVDASSRVRDSVESNIRVREREQITYRQSPARVSIQNRKSDPFSDQQHQKHLDNQFSPPSLMPNNENLKKQQPVRQPPQQFQNQQQNVSIQNLTQQQIIRLKQMQLIQLVNSITPIKQEEYGGVLQKVMAMTEEQMGLLYNNLLQMYLKKQQDKKHEQFPSADQFNTSKFINEETVKKYNDQNMFSK